MKLKRIAGLAVICGAALVGLASCGDETPTTVPSVPTENSTTATTPTSTPTTPSTPTTENPSASTSTTESTSTSTSTPEEKKVMSYQEYMAAELKSEVTIEAAIQAKQGWWSDNGVGKATFYLADEDGAYFLYELQCTEEEYNTLTVGKTIKVTGVKGEWSGEVEIMGSQAGAEATFEIVEGEYVAPAKELTLADDLVTYQNQLVSIKNLTVVGQGENNDQAFLYKWNGAGEQGDDLYYKVTDGEHTYTFVVESYLTGKDTDVYKAVEALKVGDIISVEGFMYWYKGPQMHTTVVTNTGVNALTKAEGTMTYEQFVAAELNSEVTIEAFVQAKQSWWNNKGTFYLADQDGAYFLYELPCTEEEYNTLTTGTHVKVTGVKAEWAGEVEIMGSEAGAEATFEILPGHYIAPAIELTLGDDLETHINQKASIKNLTVVGQGENNDQAFLYKYDGSGEAGKNHDLYFKVTDGTNTYTFVVESYLTGQTTDVYKAVEALKVGDIISVEGFMYWYNGPQMHTTVVTNTGVNALTKAEGTMTYEQYVAAELKSEVTIEAFVQAKQNWWSDNGIGKGTFYLADQDGAYFLYELQCTEEEYNTLTIGTHIKVTGVKGAWAGEVEIMGSEAGAEATFEVLPGHYIAPVKELTLGDDLETYQNQLVSFKNLTVVGQGENNDQAFLYKYDGSGEAGKNHDLYYKVTDGENTYTFVVESYLTGQTTDVYKAVEALKVGDVISVEGFMYWYNAPQMHTTVVTNSGVNAFTKAEGTMTYEQYVAAELNSEVTIEAFVQAKQSWWNNKGTFYLADQNGAYFVYELPCSEEEYNTLTIGTHIKVTGVKGAWAGEVEIMGSEAGAEATFEVLPGHYIAPAKKLTLADDLVTYQNQLVSFEKLTVVGQGTDGDKPFLYKYDGSGQAGKNHDLYFKVTDGTNTYTFVVESYLTGQTTDVYKAVEALKVGDVISVEGFMYWYNAPQMHTISLTLVTK